MKAVQNDCSEKALTEVQEIKLVIGKRRLVVPELLERGFDILKKDTFFQNAKLVINERTTVLRCPQCGYIFPVEEPYRVPCRKCQANSTVVEQGDELYIASYIAR